MELNSTAASLELSTILTPSLMFLTITTSHTVEANNIITTTNSNVISEEEQRRYLDQLQHQTTIILIPTMIFLVALGVTGLVGNSLVLLVYSNSKKFKRNSTSIFIMTIAVFDLAMNVVTIPTQILERLHSWDFSNPPLCRAGRYFNNICTLSSAMILVAVAIARYRKVCAPFRWQISTRHAKLISMAITLLEMIFAIPFAITNGRKTKETPRNGIYGYECTIDDSYEHTIWPTMNNAFFALLFVLCYTVLTVLYILIGIQAWKHSRLYGVSKASVSQNVDTSHNKENSRSVMTYHVKSQKVEISKSMQSFECNRDTCSSENTTEDKKEVGGSVNHSLEEGDEIHDGHNITACHSENVNNSMYCRGNRKPNTTNNAGHSLPNATSKERNVQRGGACKRPLGRTTAKLIIISIVYAVGFIPYQTIQFFRFSSLEKYDALNMVELLFVRLFLNSYLLNCAANPVIYSVFDKKFRRECFSLLKCCSQQ